MPTKGNALQGALWAGKSSHVYWVEEIHFKDDSEIQCSSPDALTQPSRGVGKGKGKACKPWEKPLSAQEAVSGNIRN